MGEKPNIIEALKSPLLFGPVVGPLESWAHWLCFLRTLYGIPLTDPEDPEIFWTCTQRDCPAPEGYPEAYAIVGRRGGKSRIVSLVAAYEALWGGHEKNLSPGEKAWVFIVACDLRQASICFGYIKSVLQLFPDLVDKEYAQEIHLKNRISVAVKTASFRSSRGYSTAMAVLDELAFFRDENSANPCEEIVNSLLPGLLPSAKLIGISTPYGRMGYLFNQHKAYFGKESDILVWQASTKYMNPTFSDSTIKRLISRDPAVFRAEFNGEFRSDIEAFIPLELLQAAATRTTAFPDLKNRYVAFCDPSGGRCDSMTLAICHLESDKVLLDRVSERTSPFDPAEVVAEFSTLLKAFGIRTAIADRFGGVWVTDSFKKQGIIIETSDLSASDIYLEFQPLLSMGKVELLSHERMLQQFQMLERRTMPGGKDKVDHGPNSHDDLANAVAGACVFASRGSIRTLDEMLKFLPVKGPHSIPMFIEQAKHQALEKEMDDFMTQSGGSRIIRR